jgi:hypothetical protein
MLPYGHSESLPAHPDASMFFGLQWLVKLLCTGPELMCKDAQDISAQDINMVS